MAVAPPAAQRLPRRPSPRLRFNVPSWLVSLVFHAALLVLLAVSFHVRPRPMPGNPFGSFEAFATAGDGSGEGGDFFDDESSGSGGPATFSVVDERGAKGPGSGAGASALFDDAPPVDTSAALPTASAAGGGGLGLAGEGAGSATGAGGFTSGSGGKGGRGGPKGGRARTSVYGIESDGYKFLYVFDRSGSMGGSGRVTPLNSAKQQLLASLEDLGATHQFQIIFYNETPKMFALAGHPDKLVFGNSANKATAEQFIRSITADGGTRHEEALWQALKLQPDVIYFLTDADQPELSPAQLEKIHRANNGRCAIHTIEFGLGPQISNDNFLMRLARENNGRYKYVDVSNAALNP